jgi:acyl carrier protein
VIWAEMDRAEIADRVKTLVAEAVVLSREEVEDPRTSLREDLGADSMDYIQLITVLERELGQHVEREQLAYVRTVGDVVEFVCDLTSGKDTTTTTA